MKTLRSDALFQLPSVQWFLTGLTDDLANRQSLLVLLPDGIDPKEFGDTLRAELWRRDFELGEVALAALASPRDRAPVTVLSDALGICWASANTPRTIMNLMETEQLPDIVLLSDLDQLPHEVCKDWVTFLIQWAQHCQRRADRGSQVTALCALMPGAAVLSHIPENSVYLTVHWWWGFPSALETRVLCRLSSGYDGQGTLTRWREYVLPALVGNDVSLADALWDATVDMETLLNNLHTLAEQRDWHADALQTWGVGERVLASNGDRHLMSLSPPIELRSLWAHGAIGWTLEYGLELHTVALVALGRHEELQHRLWRGQAELLLPFIDRMRLALCDHLTRTRGSDWPVRWCLPLYPEEIAAVRESPLACQWGHLKALLRLPPLRSEQAWLHLVSLAHSVRNELAHYRPIAFRDFERLWREVERLTYSGEPHL